MHPDHLITLIFLTVAGLWYARWVQLRVRRIRRLERAAAMRRHPSSLPLAPRPDAADVALARWKEIRS